MKIFLFEICRKIKIKTSIFINNVSVIDFSFFRVYFYKSLTKERALSFIYLFVLKKHKLKKKRKSQKCISLIFLFSGFFRIWFNIFGFSVPMEGEGRKEWKNVFVFFLTLCNKKFKVIFFSKQTFIHFFFLLLNGLLMRDFWQKNFLLL